MAREEREPAFVTEALGYIDALEREVSEWELRCAPASIESAFRAMHTLKGAAGFMGDDDVEALAHTVEEVIADVADSIASGVDRATLTKVRALVRALRHELEGASHPVEEIPESGPRELAGDAFVTLLRQGRRLAAEHGKHVQVCLSGTKVPLPEHVVETLRGPLGHIVRNAVAHAVEPPRTRARRGKPYFATILVEVENRREEYFVSVRDDGCGFDLARLGDRLVARGLATAEAAATMSAEELIELAFSPGVSTAAEVNALAGRGVGLSAARAAVEAAGGTVVLATEKDRGTTVTVRLPKAETKNGRSTQGEIRRASLEVVLEHLGSDRISSRTKPGSAITLWEPNLGRGQFKWGPL